MQGDMDIDQLVASAAERRVDLGFVTPEQMVTWGVPFGPVAADGKVAPIDLVPEGPRLFRLCGRPPDAIFSATIGDGGRTLLTKREASLVTPTVTRVVETKQGQSGYLLSVQSLTGVLRQVFAEGGVGAALSAPRVVTLVLGFPVKVSWTVTPRRLRRPTVQLEAVRLRGDQAISSRLTVTVEPSGLMMTEAEPSPAVAEALTLAGDASPEQIIAYASRFYETFRDRCLPGPRPAESD